MIVTLTSALALLVYAYPSFFHLNIRHPSLRSISVRPAEVGEHPHGGQWVLHALLRLHGGSQERVGVHDVVEGGRALLADRSKLESVLFDTAVSSLRKEGGREGRGGNWVRGEALLISGN